VDQIRIAAAETLFIVTADARLKPYDWSRAPKDLKPVVEEIGRRRLAA